MGALALKQRYMSGEETCLRVLVLDDDAFDRKRLRRWIQRSMPQQVELHEAADLSAFSEQIAHHTFDLVLLDYALADGTGIDAVRMLRSHHANAASYAVMVSGRADDSVYHASLAEGCDHYVQKSALDVGKIASLLSAAGTKSLEAPILSAPADLSALAYWTQRAELRVKRDLPEQRLRNLALLQEALGLDLGEASLSPQQASHSNLSEGVSRTLRLFISDFLACDEFDFVPGVVSNAPHSLEEHL